jgi:hypothetical protein
MMHLRFSTSRDAFRERVIEIAKSESVWTFARPWATLGPQLQEFELHVGDATLQLSPEEIRELFVRLSGAGRTPKRRRGPAQRTSHRAGPLPASAH